MLFSSTLHSNVCSAFAKNRRVAVIGLRYRKNDQISICIIQTRQNHGTYGPLGCSKNESVSIISFAPIRTGKDGCQICRGRNVHMQQLLFVKNSGKRTPVACGTKRVLQQRDAKAASQRHKSPFCPAGNSPSHKHLTHRFLLCLSVYTV